MPGCMTALETNSTRRMIVQRTKLHDKTPTIKLKSTPNNNKVEGHSYSSAMIN